MYRVDVTPVVGLPQFSGWSQVASSQFADKHFICAFSVEGDHAGNVGRDVTIQINQSQLQTADELQIFIEDLMGEVEAMDAKLHLSCGIFGAQKVILGVAGGSVFLKRDARTGVLLQSDAQLKIVEGRRQDGDAMVLLTKQAQDFLSEIELKFKSGFELDSVVTSIIPGIHRQEDSSLSSIAFVAGGEKVDEADEFESPQANVPLDDFSAEMTDIDEEIEDEEGVDESEMPADVTDELEEMQTNQDSVAEDKSGFLNVPPALKLRGAGKSRDGEQVAVADGGAGDEKVMPTLDKLGKTETSSRRFGQVLGQMWSRLKPLGVAAMGAIGTGFKKIGGGVKGINWAGGWSRFLQFLAVIKSKLIAGWNWLVELYRRVTNKDVYLSKKSPRELIRTLLPIAIGVIVVLGLIIFGIFSWRSRTQALNKVLNPQIDQLASARLLAETDPLAARQEVTTIIASLEELQTNFSGQRRAQRLIGNQLDEAQELFAQISGEEELGQLEIFYDLRLVDNDFLTSGVDALGNNAVFLDQERQKIIVLNLDNKQARAISLDAENIHDLDLNEDGELNLLTNGVYQLDPTSESSGAAEIIAEGDSNREANFIESFATYIYVFNPAKRNVYRYAQQTDGFSDPIGWLSGAASFDYDNVSSWAIDGSVWLTTREGTLHQLESGEELDFEVTGMSQPFSHNILVYTHENLENLYVLEPDNSRVVILNKEGQFLREIKSASLASTTTLFANEELGKVFAVSGSIVYAMSI